LGRGCNFGGKNITIEGHVEIGNRCHFREDVILRSRKGGRIVLKDQAGMANYCIVEATELIEIGERTGILEFSIIRDTTHLVRGTDAFWRLTPHIVKPVIIGRDCWIGSRCYICPGVTMGEGAVIGIGSIVKDNIGPFEVWAGTPAKFLYHRTKDVPPEIEAETARLIQERGIRPDRYESD
jgi:acetyltransferase-like isoleucine patch superfamily enzyme